MTETPGKVTRLPQLDLLRFAAAFAVLLYHYVSSFPTAEQLASSSLAPLAAITRYGYLGVDLFFIISGFVILWSSLHRSVLDFVVSRIGRLFPSFWTAMLITAICIVSAPVLAAAIHAPAIDAKTLLANATMLPSFFNAPMIDGVYWTLEMEIRFYAIIFFLLLFRQMQRIEWWLYAWLAIAIACILIDDAPWIVKYLSIDPYGPLFITGCLFYLILARGSNFTRLAALTISALTAIAISLRQRQGFITPDQTSSIVVPLIMIAFLVAFALIAWRPSMHFGARYAYSLGALTYPLYLIHGTVGRLIFDALAPSLGLPVRLAIITLLALGAAYAMSITVETYGRKTLDAALRKTLNFIGIAQPLRS